MCTTSGLLCASTSEDGGVWIDKEPAGTARLERHGQPTPFPAVGHAVTCTPMAADFMGAETPQVQVVSGAENDVIWFLKLHPLPFTAAQGIDWPGCAMTTGTGALVARSTTCGPSWPSCHGGASTAPSGTGSRGATTP